MLRNFVLFIFAVSLLVHFGDAAYRRDENYRQYRNNYYRGTSSSSNGGSLSQASARSADSVKPEADSSKGNKSFSAWGIIAIIVGVILVGTGGYYAFVFYPYLCKRERNYDMIELTNVL